ISSCAPEAPREEHQDRIEFEASEDHEERAEPLCGSTQDRVICSGADEFQSGANIVQHRGDGGDDGDEVQTGHQYSHNQTGIDGEADPDEEEDEDFAGDFLVDGASVRFDDMDLPRRGVGGDFPACGFVQYQPAADLHAAAGGTGAAAKEHENEQKNACPIGQKVEIASAETGGGNDGN